MKKNTVAKELKKNDFRVAIFGSARIKKNDSAYRHVYNIAKEIGRHRFDIVTGGGPGLMEAANIGHNDGDQKNHSDNIGLPILLPWTQIEKKNKHLELEKYFHKFSVRLDHFVALSNIMIVMPGGIGTTLELFYCWQLVQVHHVRPIPIIVFGKMWEDLIKWVKKYQLKTGLVSPIDMSYVRIAHTEKEAISMILGTYKKFRKHHQDNHKYLTAK
ncbi:LOG family protein [Candidatus Peregrinibacteria bacterium]|nr:LOG family protein [Candidatus Peregrinibacteria bacterium]